MKLPMRTLVICAPFALLFIFFTSTALAASAKLRPLTSHTFIDISKKAVQSVAHIKVLKRLPTQYHGDAPDFKKSSGSGFLVLHDGEIKVLTNEHVIEHAYEIEIIAITAEGGERKLGGTVDTIDTYTDLALVKLETRDPKFLNGLQTLSMGNSDLVETGEFVIAIGNPGGLSFSTTVGVVSALGRNVALEERAFPHDFIQINVDISPGNSGGPLINLDGKVVGINTAKPGWWVSGIGFAIPSNIVRDFLEKRAKKGKTDAAKAGWIGIQTQALEESLLEMFGHPKDSHGLIIAKVEKSSPAYHAGIKQGDLLIKIRQDGTINNMRRPTDFERIISGFSPGTVITIIYLREGKTKNVKIRVAPRPPTKP